MFDHVDTQALTAAAVTLVVAVVLAWLVGTVVGRHASRLLRRLPGDEASVRTRWRAVARIVQVLIVAVGLALAALNFGVTRTFASGVLASSAVLAVVVGFAAQSVLGNVVSGVLLAFNQPIRLGDRVSIDGQAGVVEEIGLSYTRVRSDDGRRVIYPNSLLAQRPIENATIRDGAGRALVRVPVPLDRVPAVRERLAVAGQDAGLDALEVVVAELGAGTATLELRGWAPSWYEARHAEDAVRLAATEVLVGEGAS